jgi:hypothetical protein
MDLIEDNNLRTRIGQNARRWARQHLTCSQLVEHTERLYKRLLGGAGD